MTDTDILIIFLVFFVIIAVLLIMYSSVKVITPYEQGIYIRLGSFMRVLQPGLNIVSPVINQVIRIDLRTQVLEVPKQEVITKDNSPTNCGCDHLYQGH